jgi:hypothetical protein
LQVHVPILEGTFAADAVVTWPGGELAIWLRHKSTFVERPYHSGAFRKQLFDMYVRATQAQGMQVAVLDTLAFAADDTALAAKQRADSVSDPVEARQAVARRAVEGALRSAGVFTEQGTNAGLQGKVRSWLGSAWSKVRRGGD